MLTILTPTLPPITTEILAFILAKYSKKDLKKITKLLIDLFFYT